MFLEAICLCLSSFLNVLYSVYMLTAAFLLVIVELVYRAIQCLEWYTLVYKVAAWMKIYHHTSSLLCGKILTMPTLSLEYGFLTDLYLEAKNTRAKLLFKKIIKPCNASLVTSHCALCTIDFCTGSAIEARVRHGEVGVTLTVLCTWQLLGLAVKGPQAYMISRNFT